nr:MAG TPA: hypothetical protein [Caudoviricetes sp.]
MLYQFSWDISFRCLRQSQCCRHSLFQYGFYQHGKNLIVHSGVVRHPCKYSRSRSIAKESIKKITITLAVFPNHCCRIVVQRVCRICRHRIISSLIAFHEACIFCINMQFRAIDGNCIQILHRLLFHLYILCTLAGNSTAAYNGCVFKICIQRDFNRFFCSSGLKIAGIRHAVGCVTVAGRHNCISSQCCLILSAGRVGCHIHKQDIANRICSGQFVFRNLHNFAQCRLPNILVKIVVDTFGITCNVGSLCIFVHILPGEFLCVGVKRLCCKTFQAAIAGRASSLHFHKCQLLGTFF